MPRTKSTGSLDPEGINSHSGRPHTPQELYTSGAGTLSSSHGPSPSTFKKGGAKSLALSSTSSALASLDAKDVAQYLTLADFNVLKNITPYEYLKGTWRSNTANNSNNSRLLNDSKKDGYTKILTRRANMVSEKKKERCLFWTFDIIIVVIQHGKVPMNKFETNNYFTIVSNVFVIHIL